MQEFVDEVADGATVLRGRCLPYGEGITYWPRAEAIGELLGGGGRGHDGSVAALAELVPGASFKAGLIGELISAGARARRGGTRDGRGNVVGRAQALRGARAASLVLVLNDLQWAEPTFIDLVGDLAEPRDAPILGVCMAHQELFDHQPGWGGGKLDATS